MFLLRCLSEGTQGKVQVQGKRRIPVILLNFSVLPGLRHQILLALSVPLVGGDVVQVEADGGELLDLLGRGDVRVKMHGLESRILERLLEEFPNGLLDVSDDFVLAHTESLFMET